MTKKGWDEGKGGKDEAKIIESVGGIIMGKKRERERERKKKEKEKEKERERDDRLQQLLNTCLKSCCDLKCTHA